MQEEYQARLQEYQYQLMYLQDQVTEESTAGNDFFRGLMYLNKNTLEDVVKAKRLFAANNTSAWVINHFIACVLEVIMRKELGEDIDELYAETIKRAEMLEINWKDEDAGTTDSHKCYLYWYELYLYLSLGEMNHFWMVYGRLPDQMKQERTVCRYLVQAYLKEKNIKAADECLSNLRKIYGADETVLTFEKELEELRRIGENHENVLLDKPELNTWNLEKEKDLESIRNQLLGLRDLPEYMLAEIFISPHVLRNIPEEEMERMKDGGEIYLMTLIFSVLKSLQDFRYNLMQGGKVARENTYNRTLAFLFNHRYEEFVGLHMVDQSQGGTTNYVNTNGEFEPGNRDLVIRHNCNAVALLEGIRLDSVDTKIIGKHIFKMRGYNAEQMRLSVIPIYYYGNNSKGFWKGYVSYLKELVNMENRTVTKIDEPDYLFEKGFSCGLEYIARSFHIFREEGYEMVMYHVMVYVGNGEDKK